MNKNMVDERIRELVKDLNLPKDITASGSEYGVILYRLRGFDFYERIRMRFGTDLGEPVSVVGTISNEDDHLVCTIADNKLKKKLIRMQQHTKERYDMDIVLADSKPIEAYIKDNELCQRAYALIEL